MAEVSTMRCTNPACNREHFSQVRYCPYCGSLQALECAELPKTVQTVTPPALTTPAPAGITQHENPTRTDDERADDELWAKAHELDTIRVYEQYLHTNTTFKKRHIKEAEQRFEQLVKQEKDKDDSLWRQACSENTVKAFQGYLAEDLYSKRHADEARKKLEGQGRKPDIHEPEPVVAKPAPAPSSHEHKQPPSSKWWKYALVGVAVVLGYLIFANLGGDSKSPADSGQQAEIADLLRLASRDISSDRLSNPPGNNAMEKYRRVLSLQPAHSEAVQGIKNIASRYVDLHKRALAQGDADKARTYLERAESLDPRIAASRGGFESVPVTAEPTVPPLVMTPPPVADPPPLVTGPTKREQDQRRCAALVDAGWSNLRQKPNSDFDQAIAYAREAQSLVTDCTGAAALLKQASDQRDFYIAEQLKKERADSINRERCQALVSQGNQSIQARRFDQAIRYATNARNTFAQCPGADSLEQEANAAIASASASAEAEKRNQCESLILAGNDALLRRDYDGAARNASRAIKAYPACTGAADLENKAKEAICAQFVMNGQEAFRAGRYSQAVKFSRRAISSFAGCVGAENLELQAVAAMNVVKEKAEMEKDEKARVRCEAMMDAGRDALQAASYDQALNSAKRARQAYSQCPGAEQLERDALEAKRRAREKTAIF